MSEGACSCRQLDRYDCIRARYPRREASYICDDASDEPDREPCECACHDEFDEEDDYDFHERQVSTP